VTLVTAEKIVVKNRLNATRTVGISKFVCQRVPDCRASVIESPTAVRAKSGRHSAARNNNNMIFIRRTDKPLYQTVKKKVR